MEKRKMTIMMLGMMSLYGYSAIDETASPISDPQDAYGAWTPRPRKERKLSCMMKAGILIVEYTMMMLRLLGIMCLKMMCIVDPPMLLAASTYS